MHVCLCEHTGDPLQSRVKEIQCLTLTILVVFDVVKYHHAVSPLTSCYIITPMVSLLCLHASHRSSPTRLTAYLTPTPR